MSKKVSFISHVRLDTPNRHVNLKTTYTFYKEYFPYAEFVFVEDDSESKLKDVLEIRKEDKAILYKNDFMYKKCAGYNAGAKIASGDVFVFLDIDIIVNPIYLKKNIELAMESEAGCHVGYNGTAMYFTEQGREDFIKSLDIKDLWKQLPRGIFHTGYQTKDFLVGNTHAVGGCLIAPRKQFEEYKGFNENFIGWGFEDNEIVSRCHILGYKVTKSNIPDDYLFHLPHEVNVNRDKSKHAWYERNRKEIKFVEACNKEQLKEYVETWKR